MKQPIFMGRHRSATTTATASSSSSLSAVTHDQQQQQQHTLRNMDHKPNKKLAIPKLRRASSKVFSQLPFNSTTQTNSELHPHHQEDSLIETIHNSPPTTTTLAEYNNLSSDYDPITPADICSFEDDGQEGSLQDALDLGDPNSIPDTIVTLTTTEHPHQQSLISPNSSHQQQPLHTSPPSSQQSLKPGKQHGAFPYPASPPPPTPSHHNKKFHHQISPSKQASLLVRQLTKHSSKMVHPNQQPPSSSSSSSLSSSSSSSVSAAHPPETFQRQPKPSTSHLAHQQQQQQQQQQQHAPRTESALHIAVAGPTALPSRLSGWFQHAFSTSSSHLPLTNHNPPSLLSPQSPEKTKTYHQAQKPNHLKGRSTPPDDHPHRPSPADVRRSPNHLAPSNIRGLGNLFDKAVNYMFDTDAHSYDSRLTADLWIIGGQQFSGVWKWDEQPHDEVTYEDLGLPPGNTAGSSSDASHNPSLSLKKRTGLRRVTVGKTKAIFKHHSTQPHTSPPHSSRKSLEISMPPRHNLTTTLSPSSTPSPELSLGINSSKHKAADSTLLPAHVTHSYPPVFYHAFASIIGLTYRTDFPPIPCTSDRSKSSAIGAAGARVGGMLASLSLSIGRTGKKPRSGQGGSRSPSPHGQLSDRPDEDDPSPDSAPLKGLSNDVGWGCMLRTGQSMLANALLVTHLGRDWRRPIASITSPTSSGPVDPTYARLLSWFIDSSSPLAPFSVHHFTSKGKELGKEVGEWFGPSTAAGAIKSLTNQFAPAGLGVATDVDGTVYRSDVFHASSLATCSAVTGDHASGSTQAPWQRPVLVLINVRLGLDGVNPVYHEAIKATFSFPQSVGIAGGRPSSSYYFCGHQGDSLFYIDPHHSRPAIPFEEPPKPLVLPAQRLNLNPRTVSGKQDGDWEQITSTDTDSVMSGSACSEGVGHRSKKQSKNADKVSFQTGNSSSISLNLRREQLDDFYAGAYSSAALQTFHPEKVRRMNLSALDPSMLLGFLVKDESDWEDLTTRIRSFKPPLIHIAEVTPSWMRTNADPTTSRTSTDFRPSGDSDLGVDSWSEPEDWGSNTRADDLSSSDPNSQYAGADEHDEGLMDGPPDDTESSTNVDPMSIDDEGWDNVEGGPVKVTREPAFPPIPVPALVGHDSNTTNEASSLHRLAEPGIVSRTSCRNVHMLSHGRAQSVSIQQTSSRRGSTIRLSHNPYRHANSLSEGDGEEQAEVINCLSRVAEPTLNRMKPTGNLPSSAFPTSQMAAATVSPTQPNRDEPRARNISAATVRARQSDEQLADSEENLNHRERRRLDSQGSLRPMRA